MSDRTFRAARANKAIWPLFVMAFQKARGAETIEANYLDTYKISLDVRGKSITRSVLGGGNYQYESVETLAGRVTPSDARFVNVGANIGTTCLNAHHAGFRDIVAFEPVSKNFELLKANLERNDIKAECFQYAAGEEEGEAQINLNLDSGGRHSLKRDFKNTGTETVVVKRIDAVVGNEPFVLWLDVEGFEREALRGAKGCLSSCIAACVEISPKVSGPEAALEAVGILGNRFDVLLNSAGEQLDLEDLNSRISHQTLPQLDLIALASPDAPINGV